MNPRERLLAMIVLGAVVVVGLGFLAYEFILVPLDEARGRLAIIQGEVDEKQDRINEILALRPKLTTWRRLSLPADVDLSRRAYYTFLNDLLVKSGFAADASVISIRPPNSKTSPTLGAKKEPIYTRLEFTVQTHGSLAALVELQQQFYRTSLLHQIRNLTVTRPVTTLGPQQERRQPTDLDITFTAEALVLAGAEKRTSLLPGVGRSELAASFVAAVYGGPAGLPLVPWVVGETGPLGPRRLAVPRREYAAIAGKNVFFGNTAAERDRSAEAVDVTQFVVLTDITRNSLRTEANLYDQWAGRKTRLRTTAGFNAFRILDDKGETLVQGTVVQIEDRDVIFRVGEKYYTLHVGQSLQEVMGKPLKEEEMRSRGLLKTAAKAP